VRRNDDPIRNGPVVLASLASAAFLLARRGFAAARVVHGGMTAWLARGWPVRRHSTPPSTEPEIEHAADPQ
jgi:3-mercaptopyruvate sulfurtransferase SseA